MFAELLPISLKGPDSEFSRNATILHPHLRAEARVIETLAKERSINDKGLLST